MTLGLIRRALVGIVAVLTLSVAFPFVALAHEGRDVGNYHFIVGWLNEPTIQGQPNVALVKLTDKASGQPVLGAEKTLKLAIAFGGGQPKEFELEPIDEEKGAYTSSLIPTKAGSYTFVFSGSVNGQPIDDRFESGPGRFDDVAAPQTMEFPEAVPAPADLAQRVQAINSSATSGVQRATLIGLAGVAIGVVGLVVGIVGLVARVHPLTGPIDEPPSTSTEARPPRRIG